MSQAAGDFDAVLILSFGGPEGPEDVMPFLQNVVRGRAVPPARLEQVAEQYRMLGGISPINAQNRGLVDAVGKALAARGTPLPVYWGNRNWHPYLADTLASMRTAGIGRAAVFATSAYPSYSGCGQYRDDMSAALTEVGGGGPELVKLPLYFDRPGFVMPLAEGLRQALQASGPDGPVPPVLMTAHSLPVAQAMTCGYEEALHRTGGLVAEEAGLQSGWSLVFQSRSGPPTQAWLEPDVIAAIDGLAGSTEAVIVVPIGFVSDHMEVAFDLDVRASEAGRDRGIRVVRTPTPGTHPAFVDMICELLDEASGHPPTCEPGCCQRPAR